ncbi:MAG: carboxypeptidase-like regulatory domain-containing protein, partial [Saprospiraceae bacterium]|nr:carboxypeptidase-like regulatory domain-containing protein [Saprospiraceae bacterium]
MIRRIPNGLLSGIPVLIFFASYSPFTIAQQSNATNTSSSNVERILSELENQYHKRIYYRIEDLPAALNAGNIDMDHTLEENLELILKTTDLGFLPYRGENFIIMPRQQLNQVYTASFYEALQTSQELAASEQTKEEDLVVGDARSLNASGKATVSGVVVQDDDNEPVIGATIVFTDLETGTATDENGEFTFELPVGVHDILVKYVGFDDLYTKINVYGNGALTLRLREEAVDLDAVTVRAQAANASVENVQIGVATLDLKNIRKVPALLGEADVVKNLLLNPGVSSLGEGSTGFNVRGGNVDQNLVQQDEGFFFNSSHALGFFSTYNADLLSTVDLYKGNMPAQYGGRLASVLDVETKNGDFEAFKFKAGVGPVTSRLSLEGPIVKDKVSFIAGARSSYSDWILKQVKVLEVQKSSAFFYDANFRLSIKPSTKSTIVLSAYATEDDFSYNEEFGFDYGTLMGQ